MNKRTWLIIFTGTVIGYVLLLLPHIGAPPVHRYEQTDLPIYLGTAVQHIEQGLRVTMGRDFLVDGTRYLNHPGLWSVILSLLVRIFGASYASARTLPSLMNVVTLVLLLVIARRSSLRFWIAPIVFFSMPIVVFFGRDVVIYSPVVLFSLSTILVFLLWRDHLKPQWFYLLLGSLMFITASFDWSGWLILPLIFFWELQEKRSVVILLLVLIVGASVLGIILWQNFMITGSATGPFITAFSQGEYYEDRIVNTYKENYTLWQWFYKQGEYLSQNFSGASLLVALLGIISSIMGIIKSNKMLLEEKVAWAMGGIGLTYLSLTAPWTYVHSYMQWLIMPSVFLFAILFFQKLPKKYLTLAIILYVLSSVPTVIIRLAEFYGKYL
jgi:4-amino-4-deoxy-L-arabinose transferase-like glycosyltransferase